MNNFGYLEAILCLQDKAVAATQSLPYDSPISTHYTAFGTQALLSFISFQYSLFVPHIGDPAALTATLIGEMTALYLSLC